MRTPWDTFLSAITGMGIKDVCFPFSGSFQVKASALPIVEGDPSRCGPWDSKLQPGDGGKITLPDSLGNN